MLKHLSKLLVSSKKKSWTNLLLTMKNRLIALVNFHFFNFSSMINIVVKIIENKKIVKSKSY